MSPQFVDKNVDLHNKAIISSDVLMVKSAISKLKQDYQDVIIWHYLDGLDIQEISLAMNRPAGTVRVMLHRGLKALKDELDGKVQES